MMGLVDAQKENGSDWNCVNDDNQCSCSCVFEGCKAHGNKL